MIKSVYDPDLISFEVNQKVPNKKHRMYEYVISLMEDELEQGRVGLKKRNPFVLETHSCIFQPYRGRGLGIELYSRAFKLAKKEGYRVRSSHVQVMSDDAKRLWSSERLHSAFDIRRRGGYWWVSQ